MVAPASRHSQKATPTPRQLCARSQPPFWLPRPRRQGLPSRSINRERRSQTRFSRRAPLVLAGAVTLEICALAGIALNFANIVALPLLLGVGVAFKIYYIMAWRAGKTGLLQSSLTRAVVFSALTTATAFGGLWLSSHPGIASMGKLMALSLVCTMAAAVLFQPVLMGPPRQKPS